MSAVSTAPPPSQTDQAGESARRRIEAVVDPGSFYRLRSQVQSTGGRRRRAGDGVVAGSAQVDGRPVFIYAQEPDFLGGSLGAAHAASIVRVLASARESGVPSIGLINSGGARMDEGASALGGYGEIFTEHVRARGWIPQLSVIYGSSAGGGCYSPALTDVVIMCLDSSMFLTGPSVVAEVLGEHLDKEELGGPRVHARNGVAKLVAEDERDAASTLRRVLSYLPSNAAEPPPRSSAQPPSEQNPASRVPRSPRQVYDVRDVAAAVCDSSSITELAPGWAPNLVVALARLDGRAVGVLANQPRHRAGVLDTASSQKGAWFIRLCDDFGLPLIVLEDTPGFMPGSAEERSGVIRHGAALVEAFASATIPRITVVLRKGFGGAFITMNSKALGADLSLAWRDAEIGIMAAAQAVGIQSRRELAAAKDPEALRAELIRSYAESWTGAMAAAALGVVDEVIEPEQTRERLVAALTAIGNRRRAR